MRSKILIFLFTILTMGLFLIPKSFAKKYVINDLNVVNRVVSINSNGSNTLWVHANTNNISGNGNYYVSITAFDTNNNILPLTSISFWNNSTNGTVNYVNKHK